MAVCLGKVFQLLNPVRCRHSPGLTLAMTLRSSPPRSSEPGQSASSDPTSAISMAEEVERPHMLNVVWRIRSLKRRPYWERNIMKQLMLERNHSPVVHKNIESVNTLLRQVRHLVRIKPVDLKHGLPNGDYSSTLLKWNGEFVVRRKLNSVGKEIAAGAETSDSKEDSRTGDVASGDLS